MIGCKRTGILIPRSSEYLALLVYDKRNKDDIENYGDIYLFINKLSIYVTKNRVI